MPPINQRILASLVAVLLCQFSSSAHADACVDFTKQSLKQQDTNLFNLCGYRGSQWTSSKQQLMTECLVMSPRDRRQRLTLREGLLANCPAAAEASEELVSVGRNRQQQLLPVLMRAIALQDANLVRSIINAGVNLGAQPDWTEASPLFLAIEIGNYHIARLLVRAGAKPYLLAEGEINPISLLLQDGPTNHAFLEFLLQNKANPNVAGKGVDAEQPIVLAAQKGDLRAVNLLLDYEADTNLYNEFPAIQKAVEQDHFPMVRALIKAGANPNLGIDGTVCEGQLALDIAYRRASERVIDLLLDNRGLTEDECRKAAPKTAQPEVEVITKISESAKNSNKPVGRNR